MIYKQMDNFIIRDADLSISEDLKSFISDIKRFMGEREDSEIETAESVNKARESGFCIELVNKDGRRIGLLIINRGVFDKFQPKYHLAYIAVDKDFQGKGFGRIILETACEVTKNSLALHVGINNKAAIEFYKKMGWKETYIRMMPEGWNK